MIKLLTKGRGKHLNQTGNGVPRPVFMTHTHTHTHRKITLPSTTSSAATQRTMEQIQERSLTCPHLPVPVTYPSLPPCSMRIQETLQREIADMNLRMEQQNEDHQEHIQEVTGTSLSSSAVILPTPLVPHSIIAFPIPPLVPQLQEEFDKERQILGQSHNMDIR